MASAGFGVARVLHVVPASHEALNDQRPKVHVVVNNQQVEMFGF